MIPEWTWSSRTWSKYNFAEGGAWVVSGARLAYSVGWAGSRWTARMVSTAYIVPGSVTPGHWIPGTLILKSWGNFSSLPCTWENQCAMATFMGFGKIRNAHPLICISSHPSPIKSPQILSVIQFSLPCSYWNRILYHTLSISLYAVLSCLFTCQYVFASLSLIFMGCLIETSS